MAASSKQSHGAKLPQTPSLKKSSSSKQTSIAGFFQKTPAATSGKSSTNKTPALPVRQSPAKASNRSTTHSLQSLTPAPSSDAPEPNAEEQQDDVSSKKAIRSNALPSPVTPVDIAAKVSQKNARNHSGFSSPSRKVSPMIQDSHLDYLQPPG